MTVANLSAIEERAAIEAARAACTRFLSHGAPQRQDAWLAEIAASARAIEIDRYGSGEPIATLERRVADLLGKPAAVFMTKGVAAQLIALKLQTQRAGSPLVALHPRCHLEVDEADAMRRLFGLDAVRLGSEFEPFAADELEDVAERLGCVTVEVPLRRVGFKATPWPELVRISAWCRAHGVPFHLDGARIWEVAPHYGRTHAEIAALADSVYVSLYKGLGALAGCVLAGDESFVAEARLWQIRLGAMLPSAFPLALSALLGLDARLPEMGARFERAKSLATALNGIPGVRSSPQPPHGNAFALFLEAPAHALSAVRLEVARTDAFWLTDRVEPAQIPGWSKIEVSVGTGASAYRDDEAAGFVHRWLGLAQSGP